MSHDENNFMAWARFRARVDGMIEQVGGAGRAYAPPELEEGEGEHGVVVELMGDWSWRPENQVQDPGYVFTTEEVARVNDILFGFGAFTDSGKRFQMRLALAAVPPRPWMVPAHVPSPGMPPRINCIR